MTSQSFMSPAVRRLWTRFREETGDTAKAEAPLYDVFRIGDSEVSADEGARLVVSGAKTATSSLVWAYEAAGKQPPTVGALSILTDGGARPVCVVETTWLEILPFTKVDEQFARDYGEWDGTLATWRERCWTFYAEQCQTLGRAPSGEMPLVCERFRVVLRGRSEA